MNFGRGSFTVIGVFAIVVLMSLSAFFSSSEIAMFALADHRVETLRENGVRGSKALSELHNTPNRLLVTILVGNNLANIAMSSIATAIAGYYLGSGSAVLVATFCITALVLLFGESAPKSYAIEHSESWALRTARFISYSEYVLLPLVITFDYLTQILQRAVGGGSTAQGSSMSRPELRDVIEAAEREGVIEDKEVQIFNRVFRFTNTISKEIMTPRLDVVGISTDSSIEQALKTCTDSGYDSIPVYKHSLDNIVGVVSVQDLVSHSNIHPNTSSELSDCYQSTHFVPESKNVDELLEEMQENSVDFGVVINEFGAVVGIVTIEDIVDFLVGELVQFDGAHSIRMVDDSTIVTHGEVNIDEVNEALDIELPEGEEFETLAGFIFNHAGRLVNEGTEVRHQNVEIEIERVGDTRIIDATISKYNSENQNTGGSAR